MRSALWLLAVLSAAAMAEPLPGPQNVLFVGNSFTYYNNSVHNHYRSLVRAATDEADGSVRIMTISGGRLPEHAAGLPAMLASERWDVVVLQGHSRGPIGEETAPPFRDAARSFVAVIREHGARPVFFMTWAYEGEPQMTAQLASAYGAIGRELDAPVVPAGLAFARVTGERPDIDLRIDDGRHPTLAGTYLAACTFFAALHGRSPAGNPYTAGLDAELAGYLQTVAQETVADYARARASGTSGSFRFSGWAGPEIDVMMHVPANVHAETPVVIVMHGASRDALRYFADWAPLADRHGFVAVVPVFAADAFAGAARYNLGHVFDDDGGKARPQDSWTFAAIEPLFDEVVSRLGGRQQAYTLYGHSAGSQFVHRYLYHRPDARVARYIAANAGWYTLPSEDVQWPYGLKGSVVSREAVEVALSRDVVLLLGEQDADPGADKLRRTPDALAQGPHRLARGLAMFDAAKDAADDFGVTFGWQVLVIPGADHDNAKMAPAAALLVE